ncbi:sensor histidine kinase [Coraliomargarita akajimensis]|uniref:histidine kinase n=1 Tax=Coraliomargarita akajimensis (strain DSM 45221 / IAM 15411 / JCM 23193 / KCTC 12865 / 04OKA010-24) TaxID=583355 RepID=D5ENE1_CORAD|nr:ATP-binding protein [Coraliomargarita akajimensis]ADE55417.1 multi-sensor signal transduction histidine kinase [Coraliomargarita akajimensis DSM 45221]
MTHLLLITNDKEVPFCLRDVLLGSEIRTIIREHSQDSLDTVRRGAFDIAIVYANEEDSHWLEEIVKLRTASSELFMIAITPDYHEHTEANAFENGANLYFSEPVPAQTLSRLIKQQSAQGTSANAPSEYTPHPIQQHSGIDSTSFALKALRDFSNILSYSLDAKALTEQFIFKLREHIRFSRIGIFLENPAKQSFVKHHTPKHLSCATSLGLPADLVECFQLSRDVGIGKTLTEHPRVLDMRQLGASSQDGLIRKEFGILGCHLALPISDRERTLGVAVLSGPVTERDFSRDELELLYLLLEELGLAIRNSRLHTELANHDQLIENVLRSMSSGAIAISENLEILYANQTAYNFLNLSSSERSPMQWPDLPPQIAAPVHKAVTQGDMPPPFQITSPTNQHVYRISIIPLSQYAESSLLPRPVMLMLEDFTAIEASKAHELQSSRDELISLIAERFAHEIRNSLVPLSTHAQLLDRKIDNPAFQQSLKKALLSETKRIKRFSEQMLYIAQDTITAPGEFTPSKALEDSFKRAKEQLGYDDAKLELLDHAAAATLYGNVEALGYALEELFLNALQSSPGAPLVTAQISQSDQGSITIKLRDTGVGFPPEVANKAVEAFYTTRNTGIGLGLSIAKKIVEQHEGKLDILNKKQDDWDIALKLPIAQTISTNG